MTVTLGHYTTALGTVEIVRIGKHGKWAFGADGGRWLVATGENSWNPGWDITGRVEPAPEAAGETINIRWTPDILSAEQEAAADLDRVKAQRDAMQAELDRLRVKNAELTAANNVLLEWAHDRAPVCKGDHMVPSADLDRVKAERDEAVELLRDPWKLGYAVWTGRRRAFLAKIECAK